MAKGFIFLLLLTTVPNLLPAQTVEDAPPPVALLNVTEIRRVMPDGNGTKDARNYATQVTVEDLPLLDGTYSFKIQFVGADLEQHAIPKNMTLASNASVTIIFYIAIPDETISQQLFLMDGNQVVLGVWSGKFNISDTKARVALISGDYLRVTTGTFEKVTFKDKPDLSCSNTSSPCYYSKDDCGVWFPPTIERCVDLEYEDKHKEKHYLKYCDDTFSDLLPLTDEPTRILLDDKNLNLRYPTTNNTYEVLVVPKQSPSNEEKVFPCLNSESPNKGCAVNVEIEGSKVDFIIATVDQSDFVEGSCTYDFDNFPVAVKQMTGDAVIASWKSLTKETFEVFIKTKSDLDGFEHNLNRTCLAEDRCESLFINVTEKDQHIVVVQNGKNAIGKTIQGEPPKQSSVTRISKTQGEQYDLTFMVQNKIDGLPAVKLIELNTLGDGLVENKFYDGSVSTISEGYLFNSNEVSGIFDSERKFYLVEYDSGTFSNVPDRCGVAYVTFTGYKFELYWVSNESYVVRGLAYGDEDITVGNETCVSSNPCYMEVNKRDEDVNICKEIKNTAPIGGTLEQCEDQTPLTPSDLKEDLGLLLIDNSNLTLRYNATSNLNYNTNARFEVLALNMDGHMMSKDQTFVCEENVVGGCSLNVTLPDESALVDFIIVSIASDKTLLESKSHVFENVPLNTWYLTEDAVIADWTQGENEILSASIRIKSDLDNDMYLLDHGCESSSCEYFFIISDNGKSDYLAVISNGTDAVAKTIAKDPPKTSTIKKISKSVISDNSGSTTFTVNGAESVPSRAKLVEVSGPNKAVVNILYDGNVTVGDSSPYEFITSDNISFVGERKFLLVEYNDEKVTRAAPAYVTFVGYDFQLYLVRTGSYVLRGLVRVMKDVTVGVKPVIPIRLLYGKVAVDLVWINDTRILRGRVHDDIDVSIGNETCSKSTSPCYHSALSPDVHCVPLCVQAANRAKGLEGKFVELCEDEEPGISNGLTVKKLQLQEDEKDDRGNITLSAACIEGSDRVGLALFSAGKPLNITEIECIKMSNTTCESSSVPLTESSQSLDIVVVCTSGENVTASGHINVDHLKFNVSKLDDSSIVVYWTAANAEEYIATLEEVEGMVRMAGKSSSEILCDSEDSCYSTFFDLDPNTNYQLSVHKEGDNSSSTGTNIEPLKDQESASTILITKVSRVDDNTTKVYLAEKCDHDQVNILVKVLNKGMSSDVSGEGMATDFTDKIFEFSHNIRIFDKEHADFTVLDMKNKLLSGTGTAHLTLKKLDVKVAWVGAKKGNRGASLRVDVGSQDKVNLGSLICEKESSPCYFLELEAGDYPEDFERCVIVTEKIWQCDEEVTPFTAMDQKDVNITLEDNVLEVVAPLSELDAKIELKVYDPSNPETVFSEGNVTCKNMMEDKDLCTQPVGLPNGQSDLKVMVTEISSEGIALKSVIVIVDVPAASTGAVSWVIAVSVLSALIIAAIGSYLIVVYVRKKKSRDWESNAIAEQVEAIDNIYSEIDTSQGNQKPHMPSRENSDSTSESSITLPERQISSQRPHTPDRRQDCFSERPFSRGRAPIPLVSRGGFPDGRFSHSQSSNELLDRRPPIYPKPQLGHRNKAFVSSESDGIGDLQPISQQKVQLSSKINLSSFQKMAGYQQSRI